MSKLDFVATGARTAVTPRARGDDANDAAMQFQKIITADIYGGRISTEPLFHPLPSPESHVGPVS